MPEMFKSILSGISKITLYPSNVDIRVQSQNQKSDVENLQGDWDAVCGDMNKSFEKTKKELCIE
jgi:hypothetical protein